MCWSHVLFCLLLTNIFHIIVNVLLICIVHKRTGCSLILFVCFIFVKILPGYHYHYCSKTEDYPETVLSDKIPHFLQRLVASQFPLNINKTIQPRSLFSSRKKYNYNVHYIIDFISYIHNEKAESLPTDIHTTVE